MEVVPEAPAAPPQGTPPEPEKKRKKLLALVLAVVIVLATIGIAAVLVTTSRPPSRILGRVEVVPPTSTIGVGGTKVYTALAFDAADAPISFTALSVQWSVAPASLGTFTNVTAVNTVFTGSEAGTGTITAQVTFEGQTKSGTATITVVAESNWATVLEFTGLPASAKVGAALTGTVRILDRFSQPYADYVGTVRFTSAPPVGATLPAAYPFTAGDAGTHTFTNGFTFTNPGSYTVTARDAANATLTATLSITINPLVAPVAGATATENRFVVSFDGSLSSDADGTIVSFSWDWGDGTPAGSGVAPTHTYAGQGTYTVTLTVTDDDALTDTFGLTVSLWPPVAAFTVGFAGMTVNVDASTTTDADANIVSYSWDWGDGTLAGSGVTASHTYAAEGAYSITLTVTDADGFTDSAPQSISLRRPTASFTASIPRESVSVDASASSDPDGTIVVYSWDWGDGTPAGSGVTAVHTYMTAGSKTIVLTVTDDQGLQGSTSQTVLPRFAPVACFVASTNLLVVDVDAACTTDVDANIVSYSWDWGDGTPAGSGVTATHTYGAAGTYTITLNVTDADGFWSLASRDVTVSGTLFPPVPCFTLLVNGAAERLEVDASCSSDADGFIATYSWDWGDGTPAGSGVTATHVYASPGLYPVNLTITDDDGLVNWTVQSVSWFPPTACFAVSRNGYTVNVDATCSSDSDGPIATYSWDWGDGTPAGSGVTASHTYAGPGVYAITLAVADTDGFRRTTPSSVSMFPPAALFDLSTVLFTVNVDAFASSDPDGTIVSFSWDWGDGTPAGSGVTATHTYAGPGRYTVALTVTDNDGFTASAQKDASVNGTTLDYTFYDFFNVPLDTWWTDTQQRQRVYGDVVLNNAYPYITWYPWAEDRNDPTIYTMYRMDVEGRNLPGYSVDDPVMLPRFGPNLPGGSVQMDLYMQYVSNARRNDLRTSCIFIPAGNMDGFIIEVQGTFTMNTSTSRELFNVVGDPATWWPANTQPGCTNYGAFESQYETWLMNQGNVVYDVYNAFEYTYSPWVTDISATYDAVSDVTTVTFHHITWGGEVLYARWFYWGTTDYAAGTPMGWWGQELGWFENWTFNATISNDLDFRLTTALAYQFSNVGTIGNDGIWNTADDNSTWVWEPMLMDYLYQTIAHPRSELTPYQARQYLHTQIGSIYYGTNYRYEYVPITWNLRLGGTWTFKFPTGSVWFYDPFPSLENSNPADLVHYATSWTLDSTVPPGIGTWDPSTYTLRVVGPTNIVAPPNPDFGQPIVVMRPG